MAQQTHNPPKFSSDTTGVALSTTAAMLTLDGEDVVLSSTPEIRVYAGILTVTMDAGLPPPAAATVKLTRDSDGDYLIAGPSDSVTLEAGENDASYLSLSVPISAPLITDGVAFYPWVTLDTGTATLVRADLTWYE